MLLLTLKNFIVLELKKKHGKHALRELIPFFFLFAVYVLYSACTTIVIAKRNGHVDPNSNP